MTKELRKDLANSSIVILALTGILFISFMGYCIFNATFVLGSHDMVILGIKTSVSMWFDLLIIPLGGLLSCITYYAKWIYDPTDEKRGDAMPIMLIDMIICLVFAFAMSLAGGIFLALFIALIWAFIMGLIYLCRLIYVSLLGK